MPHEQAMGTLLPPGGLLTQRSPVGVAVKDGACPRPFGKIRRKRPRPVTSSPCVLSFRSYFVSPCQSVSLSSSNAIASGLPGAAGVSTPHSRPVAGRTPAHRVPSPRRCASSLSASRAMSRRRSRSDRVWFSNAQYLAAKRCRTFGIRDVRPQDRAKPDTSPHRNRVARRRERMAVEGRAGLATAVQHLFRRGSPASASHRHLSTFFQPSPSMRICRKRHVLRKRGQRTGP